MTHFCMAILLSLSMLASSSSGPFEDTSDPFCNATCTGDTECNQASGCMQCACAGAGQNHPPPCWTLINGRRVPTDKGVCQPVDTKNCMGDPDGPQNPSRTPTNRSLPQYLMIGDSITGGMWPRINSSFYGNVDAVHDPRNAGDSSLGRTCVIDWLGKDFKRWDVISYNFGCWDTAWNKHKGMSHPSDSLEQYRANLIEITKVLQRTRAKLLYASTTPAPNTTDCCPNGRGTLAPVNGTLGVVDCPIVVEQYNAVAKEVVTSMGVEWIDLHAVVEKHCGVGYTSCDIQPQNDPHSREGACNVHFTDWLPHTHKYIGGWKMIADVMVDAVRKALHKKQEEDRAAQIEYV